jgi:hypothetical protein
MIKTNLEKLVEVAVSGGAGHACACGGGEAVAYDGGSFVPGGFSGINYTVKVGDPAFDWASGDSVDPGVAIENGCDESNRGLLQHACLGNDAVLVTASLEGKDAKLQGTPGTVTGKTSCGRVLVHFPKRVVERLCVGDRIQIRAGGQGLVLSDYPEVRCMNLSPRLLKALNPSEKGGKVRLPVAKVVPGRLMGNFGCATPWTGDADIQSSSPEAVKDLSLDQIRLGDLVAVSDWDASHGGRFQQGAITIGVVVHGASRRAGKGPGLNPILTSAKGGIEAIITRKANLAELLGLQ